MDKQTERFAADVVRIIRGLQSSGVTTLESLAEALTTRGIRTARGGRCHHFTVKKIIEQRSEVANVSDQDASRTALGGPYNGVLGRPRGGPS